MATDTERAPRERDGSKDAARSARSFLRDSFGHYAVRPGRRRKGIRTLIGTGVRAVIVNDRGDVDASAQVTWAFEVVCTGVDVPGSVRTRVHDRQVVL